MSTNWKALLCFGLAWPCAGLGFGAVNLGFIPSGLPLAAEVAGLFLAGMISGALLLSVLGAVRTQVGKGLVAAGYAMFAPLALMGGLLAPGPFESGSESPVGLAIMAFLAIVVYASAAIGIGLAFTGGLAVAAHSLALRIHSSATARQPARGFGRTPLRPPGGALRLQPPIGTPGNECRSEVLLPRRHGSTRPAER